MCRTEADGYLVYFPESAPGFTLVGDWFDIGRATGRSLYRLPAEVVAPALRGDPREAITHCNTVCAAYGDPAVDPRSGGVVGLRAIAASLGRSESRVRRILGDERASFVRWAGDLPASNVGSLNAFREALDASAAEAHRLAGRKGGRPRG
jgi:hypothetical protein